MFLIDHWSTFVEPWSIQPLLGRQVTWSIQGSTTGRKIHSVLAVLTASNLLPQSPCAAQIAGCTILVHAQSVLGWDRQWEQCQIFPWVLFCWQRACCHSSYSVVSYNTQNAVKLFSLDGLPNSLLWSCCYISCQLRPTSVISLTGPVNCYIFIRIVLEKCKTTQCLR